MRHAETEWLFLDFWGCHTPIAVSGEGDLIAEGNVGAGVVFSDRQNRDRLLNGRQVLLEESKREELAVEHLFASHILLIRAENSNLCKFGSGVRVTSAKLAILVVAPAVKVSILVHRVAEILANRNIAKLCLTLDIRFLLKLFEGFGVIDLPSTNSIMLIKARKVILVSADFLDVFQRLKVIEHLILIAHVDYAARTEQNNGFFTTFNILNPLNLEGHLHLPQLFLVIGAKLSSYVNFLNVII